MTNTPARLLIRVSGFFRHYGLGISHSAQGMISVSICPTFSSNWPFHSQQLSVCSRSALEVLIFCARFLGELLFEFHSAFCNRSLPRSKSESPAARRFSPRNPDGCDRHARRHLHDGEQRVEALERSAFNGHADDGRVVDAASRPASAPRRPRRR